MLAPGKIYVGRPIRIAANFSRDDVDVDPDTVSLLTRSPCGTETTYTYADADITKTSAGDYYIDITPTESGRWFYRWETTGTDTTDAEEGNFLVQVSPFSAFNSFSYDYWDWWR